MSKDLTPKQVAAMEELFLWAKKHDASIFPDENSCMDIFVGHERANLMEVSPECVEVSKLGWVRKFEDKQQGPASK